MQTTLLGLAIAFIVALVAALVGPFFIDWNRFQPQFEAFLVSSAASTEAFEIKADETKTVAFTIPYGLEKTLADMGGVLGGIGKVASFLSDEKIEYYVTASASVKGAAFDPSDTVAVTVVS